MKISKNETRQILAVIDPVWGGHSPGSFVLFWRVLSSYQNRNGKVIELVGISPEPEKARQKLGAAGFANARVYGFQPARREAYSATLIGEARFAFAQWKNLGRAMQEAEAGENCRVGFAFIIWLDLFLARLVPGFLVDQYFPWHWAAVYLHPTRFRVKPSRRYRLLENIFPTYRPIFARNCRTILTFDENITQAMTLKLGKPVLALPDVTEVAKAGEDYELAELIRKASGGRMICGMLGVMAPRKGILNLIEVAKAKPAGWFFVFAGEIIESQFSASELKILREFAGSNPENCFLWFKHIPDETCFNTVVCQCDILYAGYRCFPSSSGILTKAAHFRKPVIVSEGFLMAERVKTFGIGWTLPEGNVQALTDLLSRIDQQTICALQHAGGFTDCAAAHSEKACEVVFAKMLSAT